MDPITGLIAGGASLLGSFFSNSTSASNTQAQIQAQQGMQQQAQAYNTEMSNTAYQRATKDMNAAGLNPAMMFSSGSAASSPQMSPQQVPVAQNKGALSGIGDAVGHAVNTAVTAKTFDKMTQEIANLRAQETKTQADEALTTQSYYTEKERTKQGVTQNELSKLAVPGARVSARQAKALEDMPDWLFKTVTQGGYAGNKISDTLRPVSDIVGTAKGVKNMFDDRWYH